MRRMATSAAAVVVLLTAGCDNRGAPGDKAKPGKAKPAAAGKFALIGPAGPVEVLNGKQVTIDAELKWSAEPAEEVQLSATVSPADRGVSATVAAGTAKAEEAETVRVVVTVGEESAPGDYAVTLVGEAARAGQGRCTFSVRVPKKE
jgi:hypothetical protein